MVIREMGERCKAMQVEIVSANRARLGRSKGAKPPKFNLSEMNICNRIYWVYLRISVTSCYWAALC
jgi:hypothetical protein